MTRFQPHRLDSETVKPAERMVTVTLPLRVLQDACEGLAQAREHALRQCDVAITVTTAKGWRAAAERYSKTGDELIQVIKEQVK